MRGEFKSAVSKQPSRGVAMLKPVMLKSIKRLTLLLTGEPGDAQGGGFAQFIQYRLLYKTLAQCALAGLVFCAIGVWLGWVIVAKLSFFVFEIYASLFVIRFATDALQFGQVGRIALAMWLPITVGLAAIYLLFWNDQGRELGVGLMDSDTKWQ